MDRVRLRQLNLSVVYSACVPVCDFKCQTLQDIGVLCLQHQTPINSAYHGNNTANGMRSRYFDDNDVAPSSIIGKCADRTAH